MRIHHLRHVDFRRGIKQRALGQLVAYRQPGRPAWMSQREYDPVRGFILVRHLKRKIQQKGLRTREVILAMTLLDAAVHDANKLTRLHRRRWQVELHIRSLRTQIQMDHLRCLSPPMIRKEIHCHLIGFNLVRAAMLASSLKSRLEPTRLSFTRALHALEEFASSLRVQSDKLEQPTADHLRDPGWPPHRANRKTRDQART